MAHNERYLTTMGAAYLLGVHYLTVLNWRKSGRIKAIRSSRGYLFEESELLSCGDKDS